MTHPERRGITARAIERDSLFGTIRLRNCPADALPPGTVACAPFSGGRTCWREPGRRL